LSKNATAYVEYARLFAAGRHFGASVNPCGVSVDQGLTVPVQTGCHAVFHLKRAGSGVYRIYGGLSDPRTPRPRTSQKPLAMLNRIGKATKWFADSTSFQLTDAASNLLATVVEDSTARQLAAQVLYSNESHDKGHVFYVRPHRGHGQKETDRTRSVVKVPDLSLQAVKLHGNPCTVAAYTGPWGAASMDRQKLHALTSLFGAWDRKSAQEKQTDQGLISISESWVPLLGAIHEDSANPLDLFMQVPSRVALYKKGSRLKSKHVTIMHPNTPMEETAVFRLTAHMPVTEFHDDRGTWHCTMQRKTKAYYDLYVRAPWTPADAFTVAAAFIASDKWLGARNRLLTC